MACSHSGLLQLRLFVRLPDTVLLNFVHAGCFHSWAFFVHSGLLVSCFGLFACRFALPRFALEPVWSTPVCPCITLVRPACLVKQFGNSELLVGVLLDWFASFVQWLGYPSVIAQIISRSNRFCPLRLTCKPQLRAAPKPSASMIYYGFLLDRFVALRFTRKLAWPTRAPAWSPSVARKPV